jgi:hypothetical protein
MHTIGARKVAVILVVLALLSAALPAAAAPRRTADPPGVARPLLEALGAWLAELWPGLGQLVLRPAWEALGPIADPDGAAQPASDGAAAPPSARSNVASAG